jgi:hypothetical protein
LATLSILFMCLWLAAVVGVAYRSLLSGLRGLKTGYARLSWMEFEAAREKQPVEYWLAMTGNFGTALVLAPFLFFMGVEYFL